MKAPAVRLSLFAALVPLVALARADGFADLFDLDSDLLYVGSGASSASTGWTAFAPGAERNLTLTLQGLDSDEYGTAFFATASVSGGSLSALYSGAQAVLEASYRFVAPLDLRGQALRFDIRTLGGTSLAAYATDSLGHTANVPVGASGGADGLLSGIDAGQVASLRFTLASPSFVGTYDPEIRGFQAVPEPWSASVLGMGAVALLRRRKR